MFELIPILSGLVLGAFVAAIPEGRRRVTVGAVMVVLCGGCAALWSGELSARWEYALADIAQTALAAWVAYRLAGRRRWAHGSRAQHG